MTGLLLLLMLHFLLVVAVSYYGNAESMLHQGRRSMADCIAGADFDGDEFWLCFYPPLVQGFRCCYAYCYSASDNLLPMHSDEARSRCLRCVMFRCRHQ